MRGEDLLARYESFPTHRLHPQGKVQRCRRSRREVVEQCQKGTDSKNQGRADTDRDRPSLSGGVAGFLRAGLKDRIPGNAHEILQSYLDGYGRMRVDVLWQGILHEAHHSNRKMSLQVSLVLFSPLSNLPDRERGTFL